LQFYPAPAAPLEVNHPANTKHNMSGFSLLLNAVPICIQVQTTMPINISSKVLRISQYLQFKVKLKRNERIPNNKVTGISDLTT
jgi:hypothetical protein